ncbi:MAG: DNA primase [Planctomycetes bacterium]|nr:DNA primase [Planctomycetota bacterium]
MAVRDDVRERVRERCDLVDIVQRYASLQRRGNRWVACCPFHEEKSPSFYVSPERGTYHCFGCGASGDVFKFVMEKEKLSFLEALRSLADQVGIEIEDRSSAPRDEETSPKRLVAALEHALDRYRKLLASPRGAEARRYLDQRGIEEVWRERFEVGFAPDQPDALVAAALKAGFTKRTLEAAGLAKDVGGGRCVDHFQGRVLFPIRDATSRLVGFGGRILPRLERGPDGKPASVGKYVNSPETALFKKSRLLYGLDRIAQRREAFDLAGDGGRWGLLVEGYTDVIACHKGELPYALAALGTAFTVEHVALLKRYLDGIVVVFDGDRAGIEAAHKALPLLIAGDFRLRVLTLPGGEDPADFLGHASGADLRQLIVSSGDELGFLRRALVSRFGIGGGDRPEEALRWILHFFAGASPVRRERANAHIADALQMPEAMLRARIAALARGPGPGTDGGGREVGAGPFESGAAPGWTGARPGFAGPGAAGRKGGSGKGGAWKGGFGKGGAWKGGRRFAPEPIAPPPIDWSRFATGLRRGLRHLVGVLVGLPSLSAVARRLLPPEELGPLAGGPGGIEFRAYTAALSLQAEQGTIRLGELMDLLPEADWLGETIETHARLSYEEAKSILVDVERCFRRSRSEDRIRTLEQERREAEAAGNAQLAVKLGVELKTVLCELHGIEARGADAADARSAGAGAGEAEPPSGGADDLAPGG